MIRSLLASLLLNLVLLGSVKAQTYSILIKGGRVIDPKSGLDAVMDIAIDKGKIVKIAKDIPTDAVQVVDARGLLVTPGLIDMHSHNFWGTNGDQAYMNAPSALPPDGFTFRVGVTTVVDAGCPGWRNFDTYKKQTIAWSKTRVLVFLNIVGHGMRGGHYESDTTDMIPEEAARVALANKEHIVGFKVAHYSRPDWTPVDNAVKAGNLAGGLPVMIDFGGANPELSIRSLFLEHLRPGDIFTHCFAQLRGREFIVDTSTKKVKPFVWEARKKGIVFDVGYGGISFAYSQAIPAAKDGFFPTTISTDIHVGSMNAAMKDQLTCMSKFLQMGMPLHDVIKASTWTPAQVIKRTELGHLSEGAVADIAILNLRKGDFGLFDYTGYKVNAKEKLECEMTIREGQIVYDLNARATPVTLHGLPPRK
jgi:dihydroorotase